MPNIAIESARGKLVAVKNNRGWNLLSQSPENGARGKRPSSSAKDLPGEGLNPLKTGHGANNAIWHSTHSNRGKSQSPENGARGKPHADFTDERVRVESQSPENGARGKLFTEGYCLRFAKARLNPLKTGHGANLYYGPSIRVEKPRVSIP